MLTGRNLAKVFAAIGARLAMVVLLVFCNAFFVRAHDNGANEDARVRVTFPFDNPELRADYMANASALAKVDQMIASSEGYVDVEIVSYSSLEGNETYNLHLSRQRAASVKNYILANVPGARATIRIASYAESWAQFRAYVVSDKTLSEDSRSELLLIIDSDNKLDEKEAMVKADPNYKLLYSRYFRSLRYADITMRMKEIPVAAALDENSEISESERVDTLPRLERLQSIRTKAVRMGEDSIAEYEEAKADSTANEKDEMTKVPFIAITNNFLAEAASVATGFHSVPIQAGIEVPIGEHWSVYADYLATAPWRAWNNNADCAELLHVSLGARWYPGSSFKTPFTPGGTSRILEGWYASLSAGAGYYDFQRNGKGYQGEEILASMGFGYSMVFDEHWSVNFGIGFGPMFTKWRYYVGRANNQHLMWQYNGTSQYFGVTDAKVTLTYLFYVNKKNRK